MRRRMDELKKELVGAYCPQPVEQQGPEATGELAANLR